MQQVDEIEWSIDERQIARHAFDTAYQREIAALISSVRQQADAIAQVEDMWSLHDFLSARRHDVDGKYDYQYGFLIFVFARLVKEGWLQIADLDGLAKDKVAKISALARM
jgi:hypothetical protein